MLPRLSRTYYQVASVTTGSFRRHAPSLFSFYSPLNDGKITVRYRIQRLFRYVILVLWGFGPIHLYIYLYIGRCIAHGGGDLCEQEGEIRAVCCNQGDGVLRGLWKP